MRTSYDAYDTLALDANNHQHVYESDVFGRLTTVKEYAGAHANPDWGASVYATTVYTYNQTDALVAVSDAHGATTEITYDMLGRKTAMDDPDMGHWE